MEGADIAQLRRLAKTFDQRATQLVQISTELTSRINGAASWTGHDAAKFRSDWNGRLRVQITSASGALQHGAKRLSENADQQERASAGSGGSTGHSAPDRTNKDHDPLRPGDPGYHGMTPLEQATRGDYVALGDSYSSGEGAGDYIKGTDDNWSWGFWASDYENMSHRSENAYSEIIDGKYDFAGDFDFAASSGAVMDDYWKGFEDRVDDRDGEGPQRDHILDHDPSLVTMTMGGNDFGFGDVLGKAVKGSYPQPDDVPALEADIHKKIWGDPNDPGGRSLITLWQQMRTDAGPDARLLIGGYPQLFPDHPTNGGDSFISVEEQARFNVLADYVNREMQLAMEQSGADVEYVDLSDALKGHEVGTDDPWINDLDLGRGGPSVTSSASFHPKEAGQESMSDAFQYQMEHGRE